MQNFNALESYEGKGEFWFPDKEDKKFFGLLKYNPEKGIRFELIQPTHIKELYDKIHNNQKSNHFSRTSAYVSQNENTFQFNIDVMFGTLFTFGNTSFMDGLKITLVSIKNIVYLFNEYIFCDAILFGGHIDKEQSFQKCQFNLAYLDKAFLDAPHKTHYLEKQIFSINSNGFKIELLRGFGKVKSYSKINLKQEFVGKEEFKDELANAIIPILDKHNEFRLDIMQEEHCYLFLEKETATFDEYKELIFNLRSFFTFLILKISRPIEIILHNDKEKYSVIFNITNSKNIINDIKKGEIRQHNYFLDNKHMKENFQKIFSQWVDFYEQDYNLVIKVLYNHISNYYIEGGSIYKCYQEIVLFFAAIEQWEKSNWEKSKGDDKNIPNIFFSKILKRDDDLTKEFINILNNLQDFNNISEDKKLENIGRYIKEVRNLFSHYSPNSSKSRAQYKKNKNIISEKDISNLVEIIFIAFIRTMYKSWGLPEDVIKHVDPIIIYGR
ncbi:MAG: hypothetical protein QM529_02775 [Hydrotalea sp.]|nr:hypothetical protein [Hydrotalea sp.]